MFELVDWYNNEWSLGFSFFKTHIVCFAAWPGDTAGSGSCGRISGELAATTRMGDTSHIEAGKRTRRRFGVPFGPDCRRLTKVRAKSPGRAAGRHAAAARGHAARAITVQRPHSHLPAHGRSRRQRAACAAGAVSPAMWMKAPRTEPGARRSMAAAGHRCRSKLGEIRTLRFGAGLLRRWNDRHRKPQSPFGPMV